MSRTTTAGAALLGSPVRREILELLRSPSGDPASHGAGRTAAEIAAAVGRHVTTVRFHLEQLLAADLVTTSLIRTSGAGRPKRVYALAPVSTPRTTPAPDAVERLTGLLVRTLASAARGEQVTAQEAGRQWALEHVDPALSSGQATTPGQWLGKVGHLVDVFLRWGYAPEVATTDGGRTARIDLVDCPFLHLAATNPTEVCGIHYGLMLGTLKQLGESDVEVSLHPLVAPDRCLAHVSTTHPFHNPDSKDAS